MRLFTAIRFQQDIEKKLEETRDEIRDISERGNFTRNGNFHLTLNFLGEIEPMRLPLVKMCMDSVEYPSFDIYAGGLGFFEKGKKDELILWSGVKETGDAEHFISRSDTDIEKYHSPLLQLQYRLAETFDACGFQVETAAYHPHITIGRRVRTDYDLARQLASKYGYMPQHVASFSLMVSENIDGKLTYTEIYNHPLR